MLEEHCCETCKHENSLVTEEPCNSCCDNMIHLLIMYEKWEPKDPEENGE